MTVLHPAGWPRPRGYSAGIAAEGTILFVSGQIGWDASGRLTATTMAGQTQQALINLLEVLEAGGASPEHVTRLTWYITDKREYLATQKAIGTAYRAVMGNHYPAMSVVVVAGLLEDGACVEIEATAVRPNGSKEEHA